MFEDGLALYALATMDGLALTVASMASKGCQAVGKYFRRSQLKPERLAEAEIALDNLETLHFAELTFLYSALKNTQIRLEVPQWSGIFDLLHKKIIIAVGNSESNRMFVICEVHPAILAIRDEILPRLKSIVDKGDRTEKLLLNR